MIYIIWGAFQGVDLNGVVTTGGGEITGACDEETAPQKKAISGGLHAGFTFQKRCELVWIHACS